MISTSCIRATATQALRTSTSRLPHLCLRCRPGIAQAWSRAKPTPNIIRRAGYASAAALPGETCRESFHVFDEAPTTIYSFFEKQTSTWQYLVTDPKSKEAIVIDPVLDYDPATGKYSTETADCILGFIRKNDLKVTRILETHAHADHLTSSQYLKAHLPGEPPVCIGKRIKQVQKLFGARYGMTPKSLENVFDVLLEDDAEFKIGDIECKVMHLPGHTPDHVGYLIGKSVFTGDSIFMPHMGSARADFPGGNAKDLYTSMQKLLSLPPDYKLFVGHDYPPAGHEPFCEATVNDHRTTNKHVKTGTSEEEFIKQRTERDATLGEPRLLHPSLKVNIRAGRLEVEMDDQAVEASRKGSSCVMGVGRKKFDHGLTR